MIQLFVLMVVFSLGSQHFGAVISPVPFTDEASCRAAAQSRLELMQANPPAGIETLSIGCIPANLALPPVYQDKKDS